MRYIDQIVVLESKVNRPMANSYNRKDIVDMAIGHPDDRDHLDIDIIKQHCTSIYLGIRENLEVLFDLTLLHGALIADDFHKTKRCFSKVGENYGYMHAFIERANKSNAFRFQYRRPTPSGELIRKNLSMNKSKGGYTRAAFKYAGHDLEQDLCVMTEKDFLVLRTQSKAIRTVLRKLKTLQLDPSDSDDD